MPVGLMFALKMLDITSKGDKKNPGGAITTKHEERGSVPQKDGHRCTFASFWLENFV